MGVLSGLLAFSVSGWRLGEHASVVCPDAMCHVGSKSHSDVNSVVLDCPKFTADAMATGVGVVCGLVQAARLESLHMRLPRGVRAAVLELGVLKRLTRDGMTTLDPDDARDDHW